MILSDNSDKIIIFALSCHKIYASVNQWKLNLERNNGAGNHIQH